MKLKRRWMQGPVVAGVLACTGVSYGAPIPEALASFEVYSYQPGILANRSIGRVESEESLAWLKNPKILYYVQPAEESWSKIPGAELAQALISQKVPGLDFTWEKSVNDARLNEILSPFAPTTLRILYLEGTSVTDQSQALLAKQRGLRVLALSDAMTDVSVANLHTLPQLAELIVGKAALTAKGVKEIGRIKTLRRLQLGQASQGASEMATLATLRLDQFRAGPSLTDAALVVFAKMKTLGLLDLGQTSISDTGLSAVASLPLLHTFIAPKTLTDAGLRRFATAKTLRRLDLSGSKLTDAGFATLASFQQLEELSLAGTAITDEGITALLKLPKLRMLDVSDTRLTGSGIKRLAAIHGLQVLAFSSKKSLTLVDLKVFQGTPQLRTLIVNGKPTSYAIVNYAKATGISPTGTALGLDAGGKAPWPESAMVESLPTAPLSNRTRKGLGGLFAMHSIESDLDHVTPAIQTAKINVQTDTEDNFLGEFTVHSESGKK